ncbi:MAG: hypothetical protein RBS87_00470 [Acholeplasma sp.]|jgi:hypothetical protein|nr:hypothetical protein [Acholeplasma sp.]
MKRILNVLLVIILSPVIVVVAVIGFFSYSLVMPFERFRYKRSQFFKTTQIKYKFLAMSNEVLRTYHTAIQLGLPIEVVKTKEDYVYLNDNQGMNYIFPDTTQLIFIKDQLFIKKNKKERIPFETGIQAEIESYGIKDINTVTLFIVKDSISNVEAFNKTYESKFSYKVYKSTKDIVEYLSKDSKIDLTSLRLALPNRLYQLYIALIEAIIAGVAIYFFYNPIPRISNGDIFIILFVSIPAILIHVLTSGVFKSIKKKFPKFMDTRWEFLAGFVIALAMYAWL